jgi:hypothetical protein
VRAPQGSAIRPDIADTNFSPPANRKRLAGAGFADRWISIGSARTVGLTAGADANEGKGEGFPASCVGNDHVDREEVKMPQKRANVKNEKQYEALKDKGMSKERAAKIANSPGASSRGGKKSGSGGSPSQGGTTAQKKAAGRKGGKATARKRS